MATFEERLTTIEQEHAELKQEHANLKQENEDLKQKIELHTIAISGMVNKTLLERLNEKNDKIFQALQNHDQLTNVQLAELRERVEVQVEGKIAGLQTEVRQGFERQDKQIVNLHSEMDTRFEAMDTRFEAMDTRFEAMDTRFDQIMLALATLTPKPNQEG